MTHPRKTLRAGVTAALTGAAPLAGFDIRQARIAAVDRKLEKTITVYTPTETSLRNGRGNPLERTVAVVLLVHLRGADPQDRADDAAELIEAAMAADETFGGAAMRSHLTGTTIQLGDGEETFADVQMTYTAIVQSGPAAS